MTIFPSKYRFDPEALRSARSLRGWTQRDLADRMHMSKSAIVKAELGRTTPSAEFLAAAASALEQAQRSLLREETLVTCRCEICQRPFQTPYHSWVGARVCEQPDCVKRDLNVSRVRHLIGRRWWGKDTFSHSIDFEQMAFLWYTGHRSGWPQRRRWQS